MSPLKFYLFLASGPYSNTGYHNLRSPISQDDLPYICYKNAVNRTYTNGTLSQEDSFRFREYASVKRGDMYFCMLIYMCMCSGWPKHSIEGNDFSFINNNKTRQVNIQELKCNLELLQQTTYNRLEPILANTMPY